jgi:L-lactate dehydrogenase complex protein LldG
MSKDYVLHKVRTALARSAGQPTSPAPPVRLRVPEVSVSTRIESLVNRVAALAGKTYLAQTPAAACAYVTDRVTGKTAVASNAPLLRECGITDLPSVRSGLFKRDQLRDVCASADFGITSADYALADTGSLVMLSSPAEARLISLLPPVHIAVVSRERILTGLDELLTILPYPAEQTSSMVLITGPSRTADIEQILVRGVHGPGEIHVIVV